ncbi:hypothetical protein N7E01_12155 [Neopusillimonas aromaticivorans]|nr:hypothetical protein [Neopusillimonas aromaticivorans]WJJ92933.1 hypothetical protein N7E01_12155 [Neopusillimonas aromaticivorans]
MNRYPLWKYLTVLVAVIIGLIYTLPNFFGESPAVQIAGAKTSVKVDYTTLQRAQTLLQEQNITPTGAFLNRTARLVPYASALTRLTFS